MPVPVALGCQMLVAGGSERQMTEFAKHIDRARFQPHVLCFRENSDKESELRSLDIPVRRFAVTSFVRPSLLFAAAALYRYFRDHRIAVFHAFDLPMAVVGVPVARLARVPVVLSSVRGHRSLYSKGYRRLFRATDCMVDGIVVNAESLREHLVEDEGIARKRIHVCPNSLDLERFRAGPRSSHPLTIGCVCALRPEKNLELLLKAFAALPRHDGLRLLIVGSGPMLAPLQALALSLALKDCIEFRPATSEVPAVLHEIDIFVLPSLTEGLSNSLMEALACGCAVAASAVGGNLELIQDGENGLLFDPNAAASLGAVLVRLTGDDALRDSLAVRAAASAQERFSAARPARIMESLYTQFLTDKNKTARNKIV